MIIAREDLKKNVINRAGVYNSIIYIQYKMYNNNNAKCNIVCRRYKEDSSS